MSREELTWLPFAWPRTNDPRRKQIHYHSGHKSQSLNLHVLTGWLHAGSNNTLCLEIQWTLRKSRMYQCGTTRYFFQVLNRVDLKPVAPSTFLPPVSIFHPRQRLSNWLTPSGSKTGSRASFQARISLFCSLPGPDFRQGSLFCSPNETFFLPPRLPTFVNSELCLTKMYQCFDCTE